MDTGAFNKWAEKLIDTHKKPIVKLPSKGAKECLKTSDDSGLLGCKLDLIKNTANEIRVEIRTSRNQAEWVESLKMAKILSQFGTKIQSMGIQNVEGKFLKPYEALFLMETNRLEILEDNVPWTIHHAYKKLLSNSVDMECYKGFRKLALCGFEMKWSSDLANEHQQKKLKLDHKVETEDKPVNPLITKAFNDLQAQGPKLYQESSTDNLSEWLFRSSTDETYQELNFLKSKMFESKLCPEIGKAHVFCITQYEYAFVEVESVEIPSLHPMKVESN